jgi:uncharacterized integral membrane protein
MNNNYLKYKICNPDEAELVREKIKFKIVKVQIILIILTIFIYIAVFAIKFLFVIIKANFRQIVHILFSQIAKQLM